MPKFDITKLNVAIDKLLETTENPRHQFLLHSCRRQRYLEVAGRYEEIFDPDVMSIAPFYYFHQGGIETALRGQDQVKTLYRRWAETNQSIYFVENEEVAAADHFIASVATSYQQVSGKGLKQGKFRSDLSSAISHLIVEKALGKNDQKADNKDMVLYKTIGMQMVWRYDDRGRLIGEHIWEPEPSKAQLIKLDPADVLTTEESAKLLAPLIKPLPSFDEAVLGKSRAVGR